MAMFGIRSRCPCLGPFGTVGAAAIAMAMRRKRSGLGAVLAGIGLALCTVGAVGTTGTPGTTDMISTAAAAEGEIGEAEAAPAPLASEPPAGRLIVAKPDPVNPARIVAHTAQLPKSGSKPLFPVELPGAQAGRAAAAAPRPARPAPEAASSADSAPAKPVSAARVQPALAKTAAGPARRVRLPLAPSAAEIRRELAVRNGGPLTTAEAGPGGAPKAAEPGAALGANRDKPSLGTRLQERATTTPTQNPRWPTHVDYSAGPTGPAGGNTAADRKGSLIEATGPQQGVIRNRW